MVDTDTTIYAPATSGGGAIGIIRVSGDKAPDCVSAIFRPSSKERPPLFDAPGHTMLHGRVADGEEIIDDVLLGIFHAPRSYTGEEMVEIYCHASPYIMNRIMQLLASGGARPAEPGEFTRRAFLAGKMDLAQAEAVADVIASQSRAQHRVAMSQLRGGYSSELQEIRGNLLELASLLELELDFSEEEVEFADRERLFALLEDAVSRCSHLAESFRSGNALRNGVPVAIAGAPNSGKSTLLNMLLRDDRAIVSDIPGTTRDTVEETCIIEGILFRFIDTAGIREASDEIERMGIERSRRKLSEAEVILWLTDISSPSPDSAGKELALLKEMAGGPEKILILANKCDKAGTEAGISLLEDSVSRIWPADIRPAIIPISAKYGTGEASLRSAIVAKSGILSAAGAGILVTNERHADALKNASYALSEASRALSAGIPADLLAQDLREALYHLGTITGEITTDEILGEIFSKFCIGK